MQLYENNKNTKEMKINKILKISIIGISALIVILIILIILLSGDKTVTQSVTVDGKPQNKIFELIQYENLENNQVKLWIPIKEIAPYLGYKAYNGTYNSATEDKNKCYVIAEENTGSEMQENVKIKEVANFQIDSNVISKLDLSTQNSEYEFCQIEDKVTQKGDILYTTIEGIEKAFNVSFEYDSEKKQITIFTLPELVKFYKNAMEQGKYPGYKEIDAESIINQKAILNGVLIVKEKENETNKYGAIEATTGKTILETKYDGIRYIQADSKFLILTNKKYGIISKEGKTLINPEYDSLKIIDTEKDLYLAMKNNLYGVINGLGKQIIYLENEKIGIDSSSFEKNEIKSGYILLDKIIPVMKNKKWAFYDTSGNKLSNFEYDEIGCTTKGTNNVYGLLIIPDYNLIVVQKDKKYSVINEKGKTNILPFSFDSMYIKMENGQLKYYMQVNNKEYSILKTLENVLGKSDDSGDKTNENNSRDSTNNSITNNSNGSKTNINNTRKETTENVKNNV